MDRRQLEQRVRFKRLSSGGRCLSPSAKHTEPIDKAVCKRSHPHIPLVRPRDNQRDDGFADGGQSPSWG